MVGLLQDKVVVITGVGPGLGTTLAGRCAKEGVDLVLAARSAPRLDEIANSVAKIGRRPVAVPTDITVDNDFEALTQETLSAYGKVDGLVNNAFMYPSMQPFAGTTFTHIRESLELTVPACCAPSRHSPPLSPNRGGRS
jgi:short-subunit dehydrogenase